MPGPYGDPVVRKMHQRKVPGSRMDEYGRGRGYGETSACCLVARV